MEIAKSVAYRMELDKEYGTHGTVRDIDYVRNELMGIVNQLLGDDEPYWWEDEEHNRG